ncbi:hypothetical protein [Nostoc sp.]|uniref:hypothetical protein n=1 Tax=Nostoc sp. TaxID=1180 RepID=UPI002FF8673D
MSSYEDIRILTHIIGSVGQTCVSLGRCLRRAIRRRPLINLQYMSHVYDGIRLRLTFKKDSRYKIGDRTIPLVFVSVNAMISTNFSLQECT